MVPALAVADELRAREANVTFVGTVDRAEAQLVPAAGYEIRHLRLRGLDRKNPFKAAVALAMALGGFFKARKLLKSLETDAVIAGGGYVAGTVGLAAASLRLPIVVSEADSHLGLANRLVTPFARRVCLAFPIESRTGDKYLVTGRPVPKQTGRVEKAIAREKFNVDQAEWAVLVFGGSIGARSVNLAALDAFQGIDVVAGRPLHVLHVCGSRDYRALKERLDEKGSEKYKLMDFVSPDFPTLLAVADIVIARAGGSVFELAAAGKPAILIPYPHATADHQRKNAQWMTDGGAAVVIDDDELDGRALYEQTEKLLSDKDKLKTMSGSALKLARPGAAEQVASEVLTLVDVDKRGTDSPTRKSGSIKQPGGDWIDRHLHFIGIGGAGMSGLAIVAAELGATVTGSDRAESEYTESLRAHGIEPAIGHEPSNVPKGAEIVVSTAIPEDNPELRRARELDLAVLHRAELLAELSRMRPCIAVTGTHGKTTTTGMIVHCMQRCGVDTGYVVGGMLSATAGNAALGSQWMVVEADESDRSFLHLDPDIAVVTNVELDHHATFSTGLELRRAVSEFLGRLPEGGTAVLPDSDEMKELAPAKPNLILFSAERDGNEDSGSTTGLVSAREVGFNGTGSNFMLSLDGEEIASVELSVPGRHNVENALAALAAMYATGIDIEQASKALSTYRAASRRFEKKGSFHGADLYDDYAHHPTEVRATLDAARQLRPGRLIAVFQPHLYSRTLYLASEFGKALSAADIAVVTNVYAAREEPVGELEGIDGKMVADCVADASEGKPVYWIPSLEQVTELIEELAGGGDMVLTMGAGDVHRIAEDLAEKDER